MTLAGGHDETVAEIRIGTSCLRREDGTVFDTGLVLLIHTGTVRLCLYFRRYE
jgi:hypothetical protein